jgi:nickel-dependent lactate racemase
VEIVGKGNTQSALANKDAQTLVSRALQQWNLENKRVLIIVPDGTRRAPVPFFFRTFANELLPRVRKLDYLIALGTHPPMQPDAICKRMGITPEERDGKYKSIGIFNHRWDDPATLVQLGVISKEEMTGYSNGLMPRELSVRLNKLALDYDQLVICGPVFPHEVVGFSGGTKYLFPGISGPEVIDFTHWLGALQTSMKIIGTKETSVRAVIDRAASFLPTPVLGFCSVMQGDEMCGLYSGEIHQAWSQAADLSAKVHIQYVDKPFESAFCVIPEIYEDLWTAAKGMYKTEPAIADGGEVILYAPHISVISYTHGKLLDDLGYHVRDYFVKQWDRFKDYPLSVLAHSTHARGSGTYDNGIETPRLRLTLASRIPKDCCERVGLGYLDPDTLNPEDFKDKNGVLFDPHAGEILYRLAGEKKYN